MGNENSSLDDPNGESGLILNQPLDKKAAAFYRKRDKAVEKKLTKNQKNERSVIKLLLLGAGESGKSTVLRQMTLLHGGGFEDDYKEDIKKTIFNNVIEGAKALVDLCAKSNYEITDPEKQKAADLISSQNTDLLNKADELKPEVADAILLFIKGEDLKQKFANSSILQDSWWDFAERLKKYPEWGGSNWLPDDSDVLLSRARTTGIISQKFEIDNVTFQMTDVGGQRCERKKWIGLFQGITGLIFVASISDYNQNLYEDKTTNCLTESVNLWEEYANKEIFNNTALILFLNKFDLFQQKFFYDKVPIEYEGEFVTREGKVPPKPEDEKDDKCDLTLNWYTNLFHYHILPERQSMVYVHVTTALDTANMSKIINMCASHVLHVNMKINGILV